MTKEVLKKDSKQIGWIEHDVRMYFSYRDINKHLFLKYNAWGVSEKVINYLESKNVSHIVIVTDKKNYIYSLTQFLTSDLEYMDDNDNQIFCKLCDSK